jgi:hypothetical protein
MLTFTTTGMIAPFQVQIRVGGAFPVDWDIWDYAKVAASNPVKWNHSQLGSGSGEQWFELRDFDSAAKLSKHVLNWNIIAGTYDDDALTVDITAILKDANNKQSSVTDSWEVSADAPAVRFWVGVP